MAGYEATVTEVLEVLRVDTSGIPQTAAEDDELDKDSIGTWIDEATQILDRVLGASAAALPSDSEWGKKATRDYAAMHAYQTLGLDPEPHDDDWQRRFEAARDNPREIGAVKDSQVIRSNAGDGGRGDWVSGDSSGAKFTGW